VEPISPELALIDPELARADLARADLARVAALHPLAPLPSPAAEGRSRRHRAAPFLLALSLAANGLLLVTLAADEWRAYPTPAGPAAVTVPMLAPAPPMAADVEAAAPRKLPARQPQATAAVEQKILAAIVQSPTGKLPPALVDRTTGLAKNNLQAVCRSVQDAFLCTVRPARHKPGEGLSVRYKSGRLTWYPYRPG
jgi:hypothetical protein